MKSRSVAKRAMQGLHHKSILSRHIMIPKTKNLFLAVLSAAAAITLTSQCGAITIYGLAAGGQLVSFDTANPSVFNNIGSATTGGIVSIDFRGSNNQLYGMASSGATSTINTSTGALSTVFSSTSHTVSGGVSSFDFNPVADRMRVVGAGTNNYRIVPDGIPGMTPGTVAMGATGGDGTFMTPASVTLLDVAYLNPFNNTPTGSTILYSVGSDGILYTHPGAGGPTFNMVSAVGSLGISIGSDIGFDIDSTGTGWLVSGSSLYTVDLGTGLATSAGPLGGALTSIAVVPE
ncbi:MAG: DUF4394 domain-containing protein, partial [Verrucomicrobiaceae bacterium]